MGKTPYLGRRLGTPVQPSDANARQNPYAVVEGRYNRGLGQFGNFPEFLFL